MLQKLIKLQKNALAKITNFPVSAILVSNDREFIGVNIESDIMSSSICAERNAIFSAISFGASPNEFKEIHVLGGINDNYIITPCGVCRQLLIECNLSIIIYMYNKNGEKRKATINELLPFGFKKKEGE